MSDTPQHTPGPWVEHVDDDGSVWVARDTDDRHPVVYIGDMETTDGEDHANARLIAAAPDLLAACEELLHALKCARMGCHLTYEREDAVIDSAALAIAAARGEVRNG